MTRTRMRPGELVKARARVNTADMERRAAIRARQAARDARAVNHKKARQSLRRRLRERGIPEAQIERRVLRLRRWQEINRYGYDGALDRWARRHPSLPLGTIEALLELYEDMCTVCQQAGQHRDGCHRHTQPTRMEIEPLCP